MSDTRRTFVSRYIDRLRWENDYAEAMRWRDWQTCDQLMDEQPSPLPWLVEKFVYLASGRWLIDR